MFIFKSQAHHCKQNTKKETVITISGKIDQEQIDRAMRYLQYFALTSKMKKVPQMVVDELTADVKRGMAEKAGSK